MEAIANTEAAPPVSASDAVVIAGAGQAAYVVVRALRDGGHVGPIHLVGDEAHPPYERPPLSKAVLLGEAAAESTYLTTAGQLQALDVQWICASAEAIDRANRRVSLSSGETLGYDRLVLATGGRARALSLPGADLSGIVSLRTLDDAAFIGSRLRAGSRIAIVGGGWIGLEVAASARKARADVTVIEALPRLCARSLPLVVSDYILEVHRAAGVDVRLNCGARGFVGQDAVSAVELDDGLVVPADLVIVGVGMIPNSDLARAAGLAVASGIVVDADGRTSDPHIYAAGDVAETQTTDGLVRIESWANANEQGARVAAALLAQPRPYRPPAWFWSDQYDANIQMLGIVPEGCEALILGTPEQGAVTWLYLDGSRIGAAIAINRPRDIQAARRLIQRDVVVTPEAIKSAAGDLAALLRESAG